MSNHKRPPVERDHFFIKRLDEGVRFTKANMKGMFDAMSAQPMLRDSTIAMLDRPAGEYDGFSLVGPRDTAPPDRPLDGLSISFIKLGAGKDFPRHIHLKRWAFVCVTYGQGQTIIEGETYPIEEGDTVFIKPGVEHEFVAKPGPLHYLVVVRPDITTPDPDGTFDVVFK